MARMESRVVFTEKRRIEMSTHEYYVTGEGKDSESPLAIDFKVFEFDDGYGCVPDEVWMSGSVKWDGCLNFNFPGSESCMLHACDFEDAANTFTDVFAAIYKVGAEMMPEAEFSSPEGAEEVLREASAGEVSR